jgi:hypothetical protein
MPTNASQAVTQAVTFWWTSDLGLWTLDSVMIYLDHNATTPALPEVFKAMRSYFCEK